MSCGKTNSWKELKFFDWTSIFGSRDVQIYTKKIKFDIPSMVKEIVGKLMLE